MYLFHVVDTFNWFENYFQTKEKFEPQHILLFHFLQAVQCSELLMQRSLGHNRRTLDPLLAKCYFYHSRAYELVGRLKEIRRYSNRKCVN